MFEKESRYMVFKQKDILKYLGVDDIDKLIKLKKKVEQGRFDDGKDRFSCLVIESDWPEFGVAWDMIKNRVELGRDKPDLIGVDFSATGGKYD